VLFRLDTAELADALAGRAAADERTAALARALAEDQEQLAELTALYAAKNITAREWMEARNPIQGRTAKAEQAIARATRSDALAGLVGHGAQLRATWAGLNLTRQAAIVRAILDHAVIGPGARGAQAFDSARVRPVWRL
jgi:site-specific DNA recombinase